MSVLSSITDGFASGVLTHISTVSLIVALLGGHSVVVRVCIFLMSDSTHPPCAYLRLCLFSEELFGSSAYLYPGFSSGLLKHKLGQATSVAENLPCSEGEDLHQEW